MIKEYMGYHIRPNRELPTNYEIYFPGKGGKLPNILTGLFTSVGLAKSNIDKYLRIGSHAQAIVKSRD